jgi:hypothetical protein
MGKQQTTDVSKKHEVGKGMIGPMATEGILLGQTRHQSRTPCCFATKTRFWNLNLPKKNGTTYLFYLFHRTMFYNMYIYMLFTKQILVCTTKHTSSQIWTRFTVPSQQPLHQQSSAGCPRTKRLPGVDIFVKVWEWWLWYI